MPNIFQQVAERFKKPKPQEPRAFEFTPQDIPKLPALQTIERVRTAQPTQQQPNILQQLGQRVQQGQAERAERQVPSIPQVAGNIFQQIAQRVQAGQAERAAKEPEPFKIELDERGSEILKERVQRGEELGKTILPQTPEELQQGAVKLVQDIAVRFPARAAASITLGMIGETGTGTFRPKTPLDRFLVGTEDVKSIVTRDREVRDWLKQYGLNENEAKKFSIIAVAGMTGLDLTPFGGSEKNLGKALLRTKTAQEALETLLKTGVPEDIARVYAPKFAKEVTEEGIEKGLRSLEGVLGTTKKAVPSPLAKNPDPLAQEARKFKSVEEFVEAQPKFFHGSRIKNIDELELRTPPGDVGIGDAISFSATREDALRRAGTTGQVYERFVLPKNPLTLRGKELIEDVVDLSGKKPNQSISDYLREIGHDAVIAERKGETEIMALTKDIVKTKSQLTEIFNKAKAEVPVRVGREVAEALATKQKGEKIRAFVQSVRDKLPKAEKVAGQYVPRGTDDIAMKAKNLIKENPALAEEIALTQSDDSAVAIASELIKKYGDDAAKATDPTQAAAFYDKAAQIANTLAPKLTEQGRSIQAASILGRLTPEGQIRFAAREIQRFNELNPTRMIPELTGEQAKFISEEMKAIQFMTDGTERAMRFQKLQEFIQDLVPTPLMKKVITVWKAGLLTGIKTQGLNLFSNLAHGATEVIKDLPAAAVDSAASLFTGKRTKTFNIIGAFDGMKEGMIKGKRYFMTGFDERNIGAKLDYKRVNFGKGKVARAFQIYTDTVFRFLGAADQPFYYSSLSRSLMDQALAQGKNAGLKGRKLVEFAENIVQSPTEEMIRYGVADATTAVFQNKTKLAEAAKAIQSIPVVGEIALPFGRTPSAVAMQIVSYSPVGVVKTIIENIGKGKFDQRLFSQGIGRGITGTAVLAIGMELGKNGLVSLDYPIGDEREQELQKAEGVKPNAIKVDGKWRSPIVLGPAGNMLLIGAHLQLALEEEGSPTEALSKAMLGSMKAFLEQTFLTSVKNLTNAVTDPERYAKSYLPNLLASFVPTLVSDVSRATDPLERRAETPLERIQARVPGARRLLEPQVDILGRERERVGNALEVLADPTRPSPDVGTVVTQELRRLMDEGFRVSPTMLGDRKGFKALTQEENTKLWKMTGQVLNGKLEALFQSEQYKDLEDDQKAKAVETFVGKAKTNARVAMALELTQDLTGEDLKNKLSELKKGGLMTREVFNKYQEVR